MGPRKTANYLFNLIFMSRLRNKAITFVLVEGRTDEALWWEFAAKDNCRLERVDGKGNLLSLLDSSRLHGTRGLAAIVDADYSLILQSDELDRQDLLYDDSCPDSEMMLLDSPALAKILRNHLTQLEITDVHAFAETLRYEALKLAEEMGLFRCLNARHNYGINFKTFNLKEAIDVETLWFDRDWAARRLCENMQELQGEQLIVELKALRNEFPPGNALLCNGHDAVYIIALILPSLFKREFGVPLKDSIRVALASATLSASLRTAYEFSYFSQTSLFDSVRAWEAVNGPFRIIRD